jgi:RNA polymerase sigma-70 factor (ECF subfamily)
MTVLELTKSLKKWEKIMFAFALKLTRNHSDASDLYQETVYRAIKNIHQFKESTNLKAWLMTIMRNIFINLYRKKRRKQTLLDGSVNHYLIDSTDSSVRNLGEMKVNFEDLSELVDRLSNNLKTPFIRAYQGYKYEEIAEELNIPIGTVKSRVFMARKILRASIMKHYAVRNREELTAA